MRQLRRFAAENCEELKWDCDNCHYCISYDHDGKALEAYESTFFQDFGQIYFDTEENVQKAIETFKDELIWYFTEYRDRV